MAKVLVDQHFNVYGLPDQLHSDNGREFVNNLWKELFSEFKIQERGEGIQENWDLWINASMFAYNKYYSEH